MLIHATCVEIDSVGVLLRGPSGSGKSDLALRLIDRGAKLVADDQVLLACRDGQLLANAPEVLSGKIEVRGCGIFDIPYQKDVALRMIIDLVSAKKVTRLPDALSCNIDKCIIPTFRLYAFEQSCSAKIRILARQLD